MDGSLSLAALDFNLERENVSDQVIVWAVGLLGPLVVGAMGFLLKRADNNQQKSMDKQQEKLDAIAKEVVELRVSQGECIKRQELQAITDGFNRKFDELGKEITTLFRVQGKPGA